MITRQEKINNEWQNWILVDGLNTDIAFSPEPMTEEEAEVWITDRQARIAKEIEELQKAQEA